VLCAGRILGSDIDDCDEYVMPCSLVEVCIRFRGTDDLLPCLEWKSCPGKGHEEGNSNPEDGISVFHRDIATGLYGVTFLACY
jgi:hypothetical protein